MTEAATSGSTTQGKLTGNSSAVALSSPLHTHILYFLETLIKINIGTQLHFWRWTDLLFNPLCHVCSHGITDTDDPALLFALQHPLSQRPVLTSSFLRIMTWPLHPKLSSWNPFNPKQWPCKWRKRCPEDGEKEADRKHTGHLSLARFVC